MFLRAAILFLAGAAAKAHACAGSLEESIVNHPVSSMSWANAVFHATVLSWAEVDRWTGKVTIDVHDIWKGVPTSLLYNDLSSSCSRRLKEGERYLIYATRRPDGTLQVEGSFVPFARAGKALDALRRQADLRTE